MFLLLISNQELYLDTKNKVVILDISKYTEFFKKLMSANYKENEEVIIQIDGNKINEKNSLILDFSSISGIYNSIYNKKVKEEYMKTKMENYVDRDKKQELLTNELLEIFNHNFKDIYDENITLDIDKLVKQYINIEVNNFETFFNMLNFIIEKSNIKIFILIYTKELIEKLKLNVYIENINANNVIKIEICSNNSKILKSDNLIFINEMFYQISGNDLYNFFQYESDISDKDIENNFINAINYREVDAVERSKLLKLNKVCEKNLKIKNLNDFKI